MINSLNRFVPEGMKPFEKTDTFKKTKERILIPEVTAKSQAVSVATVSDIFDLIPVKSGMTLSFHHHLRNGDGVMNMV
ncbi:MAG: hypothetical protein CVV58_04650, partial [Tenericutes bacterium HGW-Tenericutes-3]